MPLRKYWTLEQIQTKIKKDTDTESENFVRPDELIDLINEAIDECEAEIHSLYEDYFLTRLPLTLVEGQELYDLPANIYAHKIRRVVFNNTSSIYTIDRIKDWKKFEQYDIAKTFETSDLYQYFIDNPTAGSPQLLLVPPARDAGQYVTIWYLRQANRLEVSTDICDIPEFVNFIFAYVKYRIYFKEGHPVTPQAEKDLEKQRMLMAGTLAAMIPDADNDIELDMTHYEEMN